MQVKVDLQAIEENITRIISAYPDMKFSVMVKNFYSDTKIADIAIKNKVGLWSNNLAGGINYILNANNIHKHLGGIVLDLNEVRKLSTMCLQHKRSFQGYIPIDAGDRREGLSLRNAILLKNLASEYENEYFTISSAMITSGCTNGIAPSLDELRTMAEVLKMNGFNYLSIGGSYYLGRLFTGQLDNVGIDEIRFGEYALYGTTTPYFDVPDRWRGKEAIRVFAKVIWVYPDRKQFIVDVGQCKMDSDKSRVVSDDYSFSSCSTEYTVLNYEKNMPSVGDEVEFVPDYHSLIKLF